MSGLRFARPSERSTGTSKLLEKVSKQLRGSYGIRASGSSDDDDQDGVSSYLKMLSERTSKQSKSDDLSGEDSDNEFESKPAKAEAPLSAAANRFLKKPSPAAASSSPLEEKKPVRASTIVGRSDNSPTLSKVAKFTSKYGGVGKSGRAAQTSDSDVDLNLSMDEEVLADVREMKKNRPVSAFAKSSPKTKKSASKSSDEEEDSMKIGKSSNKFLKTAPAASSDVTDTKKVQEKKLDKTKGKDRSFTFKSSNTEILLDSDEESMADFIDALSGGSSGRKSSSKDSSKMKPRAAFEPDSSSKQQSISEAADSDEFQFNVRDIESLEDVSKSLNDQKSSVSSEKKTANKAKMTKGQEYEKKPRGHKARKDSSDDVLHQFGLLSIDDLQGIRKDSDDVEPLQISEMLYESDFDVVPLSSRGISPMPLRSILSPTPRSMTPRSSRSRVRLMDELTEIRSRSPTPETPESASLRQSYGVRTESVHTDTDSEIERTIKTLEESSGKGNSSSDTEENSTIKTLSDASTASSFDRMSATRKSHRRIQRRPSTSSRRSSTSSRRSSTASERYYSDDFTKSSMATSDSQSTSRRSSYTEDTESQRSSPRSPRYGDRYVVDTKDSEVQTGLDIGLHYHWVNDAVDEARINARFKEAFAEPSSIGTSVVNVDALNALTNFSPSSLALNELIRQQMTLTNHLMSIHQRLHRNVIRSLDSSFYSYTTLKNTKEFIKRHAKPLPSFEETLMQVKEEMGMKI